MRNARFRPDGTLEGGVALRRQRNFYSINFQALPFLEATFRLTDRLDATAGRGTSSDRAFDLKFRLWEESAWVPALAIGLQDSIGTGIYGGEYLVASKRFPLGDPSRFGTLDTTIGMGWGRLGTGADLGNPLGLRGRRRDVGQGGQPSLSTYFRGEDTAIFGGLEWLAPSFETPLGAIEGVRAKLEWSGDALRDERGGFPARTEGLRGRARSRLNVGLQWQPNDHVDVGLAFVHGTDLLLRASLRLDPARPPESPLTQPAPRFTPRPLLGSEEKAAAGLREAGFRALSVVLDGIEARIAIGGGRHATLAQTVGRAMAAVQPALPPEIERVAFEWHRQGVAVARLTVLRREFEAASAGSGSAEEILASTQLRPAETDPAVDPPGRVAVTYGIEPRLAVVPGDPGGGVLYQFGLAAGGRLSLGGGVGLAGSVSQRLLGTLGQGRDSTSELPRVRSDYARYAREGETSIPALYAERLWTPAPDWFARVSGGLLEPNFSGISAEVLWRPKDRPIALGLDLNGVAQRAYDGLFGNLGYSVATGHLSFYADLPLWNLYTVVRGGRYLAGDWGGTLEVGRRFASGIEVGGFATLTDVPFSRFGEGSFDKGIYIRFPLALIGARTASRGALTIRPTQRDGGQRLAVDNALWDVTRDGRAQSLVEGYQGFLR